MCVFALCIYTHIHTLPCRGLKLHTFTNAILPRYQTNVYEQLSQLMGENVAIQSPKTPREFMPDLSLNPSPCTRQSHWYLNPMVACSAFRFTLTRAIIPNHTHTLRQSFICWCVCRSREWQPVQNGNCWSCALYMTILALYFVQISVLSVRLGMQVLALFLHAHVVSTYAQVEERKPSPDSKT